MIHRLRLAVPLLALGALGAVAHAASDAASAPVAAVLAAPAAPAAETTAPAATRERHHEHAVPRCEAAVGDAIRQARGKQAVDIVFAGEAPAIHTEGDQVDVKGAGRYRRAAGQAPVAFRYTCAFDAARGTTSGVLFREAEAPAAPAALPVWQADLTKLSPEACESAAAASVQAAHPRATGIVFDGNNRKLEPGADGGTALSGSGRMIRSPGLAPSGFRYRCEFDAQGRVAGARTFD